jgi:hypothetical protein
MEMSEPLATGPRGARIISFEAFVKRQSAGREPAERPAVSPFARHGSTQGLDSRQITHRRAMLNYLRVDR